VFQDPDDQLFMPTVRDDVEFGPRNLGLEGIELDDRVATALRAMEVADLVDRPPNHLSFGQKRRVAIAGVLAMEPEILVLDEPTSNLDPASRRELASTLHALDTTLLVVTHDLPFALEMCPRTLVMDGGEIVANESTTQVLRNEAFLKRHRLELPYGFALETGG
jgi:cobalt/nickel transport system ATP-binding protein